MSEYVVPREAHAYLPLADIALDGTPVADPASAGIEVGISLVGMQRPITWTGWPGPKNPQTRGSYLVLIRKVGASETEAAEVGVLRVT